MARYLVRIKPGLTYRADGRVSGGEEIVVTEDEVHSFGDKFELLETLPQEEPAPPPPTIDATSAAERLAVERGIALEKLMPGSGVGGRILLKDVRSYEGS